VAFTRKLPRLRTFGFKVKKKIGRFADSQPIVLAPELSSMIFQSEIGSNFSAG
jgi:hypothetical protein